MEKWRLRTPPRYAASTPYAVTNFRAYLITKKERYERFVEIVREVGLRQHASVFGRYELMKEWADTSNAGFRAMLADDAFHMSDQGYACLGRILSDEIVDAAQRPALTPQIQ